MKKKYPLPPLCINSGEADAMIDQSTGVALPEHGIGVIVVFSAQYFENNHLNLLAKDLR